MNLRELILHVAQGERVAGAELKARNEDQQIKLAKIKRAPRRLVVEGNLPHLAPIVDQLAVKGVEALFRAHQTGNQRWHSVSSPVTVLRPAVLRSVRPRTTEDRPRAV